jgi:hypothetical protein
MRVGFTRIDILGFPELKAPTVSVTISCDDSVQQYRLCSEDNFHFIGWMNHPQSESAPTDAGFTEF